MIKKNVLLAITGLSPQVVTETLYGIVQNDLEWPDEIQIITTKKGRDEVRLGLLESNDLGCSMLEQFCIDYGKQLPTLTLDTIYVVPDAEGNPVDDARTYADQEALSDFIVRHVGQLCRNEHVSVHASLAGGRKTMTFFLGYAMTLFGRMHDRLSHVLVDAEFEGNRQFYYPTPKTKKIESRGNNGYLDASLAKVMLAEIPFIRQRNQLNKQVFANLENQSYRDMTRLQNNLNTTHVELHLDIARLTAQISSDSIQKEICFVDKKLEFAFYVMATRAQLTNEPLYRPFEMDCPENQLTAHSFLQELERVCGFQPLEGDFATIFERRCDVLSDHVKAATVNSLKLGMSRTFFDQRKNTLKKKLQSKLPSDVVDLIMPNNPSRVQKSVGEEDKKKVSFSITDRPGRPYPRW